MAVVESTDLPHLGGNMDHNDLETFTTTVWDYVIDKFKIKSALDLGSGYGFSSQYFFDKSVATVAVDGLEQNVYNAVYPTVLHDLTKGPFCTQVDLVHCQEVVEHIEEKYLDNLLKSMACGKYILMTNALPGQLGYHHVNLQNTEYWIEHLKTYGFEFMEAESMYIRGLAKANMNPYMAKTGSLFINQKTL